MPRAQQGRAAPGGKGGRHPPRDPARLGIPRPERAADGVDDAALDFAHDRRRQVLELQSDRVIRQLFRESFHFRRVLILN